MPRRSGCLFSLFDNGKEAAQELPYERCEGLLTQAERSFYYVLLQALEAMGLRTIVCPKVGLRDVFRVVIHDNAEYMSYLNKINRKHVDFLLCDPRGMELIAGVELDDSTHLSERGRARDAFVEKVYAAAGLPLLRFRVQHTYDIPDMVRYMRQELALAEPAAAGGNKTCESITTITSESGETVSPVKMRTDRDEAAAAVSDIPDAPQCPRCGAPMVLRKSHRGRRRGQHFWGCSRFPRCRCVVEMKVNVKA